MNKGLKALTIVLGAIIMVLLGILIFVPAPQGSAPSAAPATPAVSADGHLNVAAPFPGSLIVSPVAVSGTVTGGGWFFEATFPVVVEDANGAVLGTGVARAESDWTTTGTVPFSGSISFATTIYTTGTIVFKKDNPSGLPQNAGELRLPVRFR